ncbi:MAG: hypothetical protein SPL64_05550 [Bacteroidaceae bacterium]|nr:hypothetical protein [Bacteroidaceae bacterium]
MFPSPLLNEHHKQEFAPAHTAEHLLNQTMVRMYGCERSRNAHIERKKSKISFELPAEPSAAQVECIVSRMNELIEADLPVGFEFCRQDELPKEISKERLPEGASDMVRIVRIGDYDVCLCAGNHVKSTREIGQFVLLGTNWDEQRKSFRIRFKLVGANEG